MSTLSEGLVTDEAVVGALACMHAHVVAQVARLGEALLAHRA